VDGTRGADQDGAIKRAARTDDGGTAPRRTVLIVDDQTIVREALSHMFRQTTAFQVVGGVAGGDEAVSVARRTQPDIALVDLNLPGRDGIEVTRGILLASPETRVVILTAVESEEGLMRALRVGVRGYILKSLPFAGLVNSLNRVLSGEVALPRDLTTRVVLRLGSEHRHAHHRDVEALTDRERQILRCLADGETNRQIAARLVISEHTVRAHMRSLLHKLGVSNRSQAAALAVHALD
jgi:two-component system nitrate/nitrite response regulator NarL